MPCCPCFCRPDAGRTRKFGIVCCSRQDTAVDNCLYRRCGERKRQWLTATADKDFALFTPVFGVFTEFGLPNIYYFTELLSKSL